MCGIAGFISPNDSLEARSDAVTRMCAAMLHRGPDDSGITHSGNATIGMRRLAIFDPTNGHQPMASDDGRFRIVFNGAIYNFRALRDELAALGFTFRTNCDTEVLLAAFAQWGEHCLSRLRGMFAFAVWDTREQMLFLTRDPFGIKPLYYQHNGTRLLFASELNALLASGECTPEIDLRSVADYLGWFAVPAPRTIYRGIFSLRPGECAIFRAGRLDIQPTWSFRAIPPLAKPCGSRAEFTRDLRTHLDDTIRAHMIADVPVGAFLSGGLDSAVVTGLMTKAGVSRLRTFSIGFDESAYSEADAAAATARHYGTEHHATVLTGAQVAQDLDKLLAAFDQPTGDGVNTYYVSQAARAGGVTVALSGLGGDELFGGYPSFRDVPRLARWLPLWTTLPSNLRKVLIDRLRRGGIRSRKLADFLQYARGIHELGALQRRVISETRRDKLLNAEAHSLLAAGNPCHPELDALSAELEGAGTFEIISAWELRTYMSDVLLRDSDVMSMRHSLELRVPFVDRPLIEWLWHQPAVFKDDRRQPKSALAAAVNDIIPPALHQRQKRGFSLPFAVWMKNELHPFLAETFSSESIDRGGLFSRETVQEFWRGFQTHNDTREWSRVWSLAVLIAFANRRSCVPPAQHAAPVILRLDTTTAGSLPAASPVTKGSKRMCTLLLAPEIFASEGGIPRIMRTYLRALCDLAVPESVVRLVALNDATIEARDLNRYANNRLEDWIVCGHSKPRFIRAALQLSIGYQHLICGHIAQLPVALVAKIINPSLHYYLVAHGIEVWRPFNLAERFALRGARKIFCVSDYTRRELLKNCPLPEGRTVVLNNALDPDFEIARGTPLNRSAPVILVVTRLTYADRYKGVQHMIEAMPAIRAAIPDATLRIVGRGDDSARLQQLSTHLGLGSAVTFLGYLDDRRLKEELSHCSLFALPSRKEGFGLVYLEAMAHGRPCLGARAGGTPEVISEDTGVLVEYGNVPGIATASIAALQRTWNEEDILARASHFSYSRFRQQLVSLLN